MNCLILLKALKKERSDKSIYDEEHRRMRFGNHPWRQEVTADHYADIDMDLVKDVFRRSFCNYGMLTIYVCDDLGNEEMENLQKMVAALPVDKADMAQMGQKHASWPLYRGRHRHMKQHKLQTVPKSEVNLSFKYELKLKNEEFVILDILDYIMDARCMNKIREERGGTYSVTFSTEVFNEGKVAESSIEFQTRPEMTDLLVNDAKTLVKEMAENGPAEAEFENARKYLAKHHSELQARYRQNLSRKLNVYMTKERYGIDKEEKYIELLEKASIRDVRKMAAKIAKGDSMLSVYTEN